jgi:hypothetical protein
MKRDPYPQKKIRLIGQVQLDNAITVLKNAPLDTAKPLEFILREEVKPRRVDQNSLMWSCQLKCIAEQAYVNGRTYSAEVWHEHAKEMFLPEIFQSAEHQAEIVKEGYRKYDTSPSGKRILVGSTTELTIKGFAIYLQQVEAFGANLGVIYSANPNEAYT